MHPVAGDIWRAGKQANALRAPWHWDKMDAFTTKVTQLSLKRRLEWYAHGMGNYHSSSISLSYRLYSTGTNDDFSFAHFFFLKDE